MKIRLNRVHWRMAETKTLKRGRRRTRAQGDKVRALDRGLAVLEVLAKAPELPLTELADRVGLAYSTAHRILETLRQRGFVTQSAQTGLYSLGIRAFEIGAGFLAKGQLPDAAQGAMKALVEALNETVNLAVQDGGEAIYIHQVEGRQKVRMFTQIGARTPLHASGVGKVLLAWQAAEAVRRLLRERPLTAYTDSTLTRPESVFEELSQVRERGYALDLEEFEPGVRCVAAPVRERGGAVVAALSVSAPTARLEGAALGTVAEGILRTAREISTRLGWLE